MGNLFDYVNEYGDIKIEEKPLTEVDLIIFAQFCYLDFLKGCPEFKEESKSINFLANKLKEINYSNKLGVLVPDTVLPLFYLMSTKKRYKDLFLSSYEKVIDKNNVEQFCAITIIINDKLKVVSFCGTDDSIVGWEENLNMLYLKATPSQIRSKDYLNRQSNGYKGCLYVTGHSKGGNLAFYSVLHSNRYTKEKLIKVYSFDGPGLTETDCKSLSKSKIYDKYLSYITECSVVGKLFENTAKTIICKSSNKGLLQHDSFSWIIEGDSFVKSDTETEESINIDKSIKEIIESMSEKEKQDFTGALFKVISYTSADNLVDIKLKHSLSVIKGYFKMNSEDRKLLRKIAMKMVKNKYLRKIFFFIFYQYFLQ